MDDNIKTGHNINAALKDTATKIANEHNSLIALVETVEAKQKRIGELLIEIKPTIKDAGLSMTDFCREHLPFGKSAAYEYIAIAKGETTATEQNVRKNNSATAESFEHWTGHKDLLNLLLSQEHAIIEVEEARALNDLSAYEQANVIATNFEEELGASRTQLKSFWDTYNSWRVNKLLCCFWVKVTKPDEFGQMLSAVQMASTIDHLIDLCCGDKRAMWFAVDIKLGQIIHDHGWETEERQGWKSLEATEADIKELCDKHGEDVVHKALMGVDAAEGHKQTLDAIAERVRANMTEARASKTKYEAALAELKANDTDEGKAAYAKLLAETQPVLDIVNDVLGED